MGAGGNSGSISQEDSFCLLTSEVPPGVTLTSEVPPGVSPRPGQHYEECL